MRFSISSFFTLAVAAAATVFAQPAKRAPSINPPQSQNKHVDLTALPPVDVSPMTNAKRFARGLPPLNPVKRRPHRGGPHKDGAYPHGGTRVGSAPRAEISSTPGNNVKCNILVKTTEGIELGYIPASFNDFGQYGTPQGGQSGALEITFPVDTTSTESVSQINGVAVSAPDAINSFPYLSATLGYYAEGGDLGSGNSNYVAITGNSGPMNPGSPASSSTSNSYSRRTELPADSETAIWSYDPASKSIQAVWTNTGGESVPTTFVYFEDINEEEPDVDGNTLVATGDLGAFQDLFSCSDTCRPVTFTCVPTA